MSSIVLAERAPNTIIEIIRRSLSYIDPRLMEHGERVAFIAEYILYGHEKDCRLDPKYLFLLSLLHDVGAYKTEEIGDMVQFEMQDVQEHAVYGYLFLNHASHFGERAKAVLYHHADYDALCLSELSQETRDYAALIHLADRIDVLMHSGSNVDLTILHGSAGKRFAPRFVDWFFEADEKYGIVEKIRSGAYKKSVAEVANRCPIGGDEAESFLKMLVYAIDFRSPLTVTHTADTTSFALAIAKRLGFDAAELDTIQYGAFLHDVGKIAIPVEILEKPGRLTDAEMAIMQTHIIKTGEIIAGFTSGDVFNIAFRHHEKLDGSGYPIGLTAEALTKPERLVAVADIASALVGRRSYKEPMPKEQVLGIIHSMCDAGKLDAECCGVLFGDFDRILEEVAHDREPIVAAYEKIKLDYANLVASIANGPAGMRP